MNDGYITKPLATAFKILGFHEEGFNYYLLSHDFVMAKDFKKDWNDLPNILNNEWFSAPTWTQAAAWIFGKSKGEIAIQFSLSFEHAVVAMKDDSESSGYIFTYGKTFEEAFSFALNYLK